MEPSNFLSEGQLDEHPERHPAPGITEDQVVDEGDAQRPPGRRQALGEGVVVGARAGVAARVGVEDHHRGGAEREGGAEDDRRLDLRPESGARRVRLPYPG